MRGFERVRRELLKLAEEAVGRGQIPSPDALWDMSVDETLLLDVDWAAPADFFENRRKEIEELAAYDMPDSLNRFDDLDQYNPEIDPDTPRVSGMSLVSGDVVGKAWVLREPSVDLPVGYDPNETILVARAVDAGWIPTFARVAGVVVETGGDLSHGSIILRELRIPSITNARNATRIFKDGDALTLNAGSGSVKRDS